MMIHVKKYLSISLLSLIIRKLAHFTEHITLGVLVINMFTKNNYATSDEIHQVFTPARAC